MGFFEIAKVEDMPKGTMKSGVVGGKEILVTNYDGTYYAIGLKCTHMGGDLSKGRMEGKIITCPRHGSRFDVTTGERISGPKVPLFKPKIKNEPYYQVKVVGNSIQVNIE